MGVPFIKLKELPDLLNSLIIVDSSWAYLQPQIDALMPQENEFGGFGYPGVPTNQETAVQSLQSYRHIREVVRSLLIVKPSERTVRHSS